MKRLVVLCVLGTVVSLAAACGAGDSKNSAETLTVLAAASLTNSFTELGKEFEADHPGTAVRFSFAGSSDLVAQIQSGAPADVFASADLTNMAKLGDTAVDPKDFASNTLEIAVPPGNPAGIARLADLAKPGLKLVICAPEVPCGTATQAVARSAGLTLTPVSQEQSVTDVLGKVATGEADAGLVYVTDVKGAGADVEGITFPEASSAVNVYPISVIEGSKHADLAREFVAFVLSSQGHKVLADAGFGKP